MHIHNTNAAMATVPIPAPPVAAHVFVRCATGDDDALELIYRALPDVDGQPFPRVGNIWGTWNFDGKPIEYAAGRADLWLGAGWTANQTGDLRKVNPYTVSLTSINACEGPDGLPEECVAHSHLRSILQCLDTYRLHVLSHNLSRTLVLPQMRTLFLLSRTCVRLCALMFCLALFTQLLYVPG